MAAIGQFFSLRKPGSEGHARVAVQDQLDANSYQFKPRAGNPAQKASSILSIILIPLFSFFLPFWSYLLNDVMTPDLYGNSRLCDVNGSPVNCGSPYASTQMKYAEMVEDQNQRHPDKLAHRYGVDGKLWACGCEQGWLGDWVCPIGVPSEDNLKTTTTTFSLSYFIATAPGTGAMAAVSFWGIISFWLMGSGSVEFWQCAALGSSKMDPDHMVRDSWGFWLSSVTLCIFQICFGIMLMTPLCIAPDTHTIVTAIFVLAEIVHFVTIALVTHYNAGTDTTESKIILAMTLVPFAVMVVVSLVPAAWWPGNFGLYAFFYAECLGLSVGLNIPSVLAFRKGTTGDAWYGQGNDKL